MSSKIPDRHKKPRIRMIIDLPVDLFPELTSMLQWFASKKDRIILVATSTDIVGKRVQQKMRESLNKILEAPDADLSDSISVMEKVSKELSGSHDITEFKFKKKNPFSVPKALNEQSKKRSRKNEEVSYVG